MTKDNYHIARVSKMSAEDYIADVHDMALKNFLPAPAKSIDSHKDNGYVSCKDGSR